MLLFCQSLQPNAGCTPLKYFYHRVWPATTGFNHQAHQVRTISKMRLGNLIGYLEDEAIRKEVDLALKEAPGLEVIQVVSTIRVRFFASL